MAVGVHALCLPRTKVREFDRISRYCLKKNSVIFYFRFIKTSRDLQIAFGSRVGKLDRFSDRKVADDLGIVRNFVIFYKQNISPFSQTICKGRLHSNIIRYRIICYNNIVLSRCLYNISVVFLDLSNFM